MKSLFRLTTLILTICMAVLSADASRPRKLVNAIDTLDLQLENYRLFREKRQNQIDSLYLEAHHESKPDAKALYELGRAYFGFNNDSASTILNRAINAAHIAGDSTLKRTATIEYASVLPKSGIFTDAITLLNQMHIDSLTHGQKLHYYGVKSQIMINAAAYPPFKPHEHYYDSLAVVLLDSLKTYMRAGGLGDRLVTAQSLLIKGDDTLAFSELSEALEHTDPTDPSYAILTGMLAKYFKNKPDRSDEYLYYLTLSATADVTKANGEAESLLKLGNELFNQGDYDHAFTYLTAAGKFMAESGSRTLITEVAPPIAVYSQIIRKKELGRKLLMIILIMVCAIICAIAGWLMWRSHRKDIAMQEKYNRLASSVNSRDQYINELLNLCSVYVESMEDYNKFISRKLKANQAQDLLKTVEAGKALQDQTEKFFTVFDHAIFKIYPDFVDELNALLIPDKRFTPPVEGKLLPEMRIAAFMRLGVTDSTRLSKFLGLSLNTVYTYRNRLKTRAINRNTFESDIVDLDHNKT